MSQEESERLADVQRLEAIRAIDREHERRLVRQCADLRIEVNRLEAELTELRDPEEKREDGKRVRKDRWETGIRNIANALGWRGPQEVGDVVAAVRKLIDDRRGAAPPEGDPNG